MTQANDWKALKNYWFRWMLDGKGREKHAIGKYRYDGPILYMDGTPSQRLTKSKRSLWVLMCRYGGNDRPDWAKDKCATVVVPDIACFSQYSGDWYDDDEDVHGRQKYIMLMRINALLEEVGGCTGKHLESKYVTDGYERTLTRYYNEWDAYDFQFLLGWGSLPEHYEEKMRVIIKAKIDHWRDPVAVMKRERAMARKSAKKALGLIQ